MLKNTKRLIAIIGLSGLAVSLAACGGGDSKESGSGSSAATKITFTANAISGGKNTAEAEWIEEWVIPNFEEKMASEGENVTVAFEPQGVDDEDYKTKLALDLQSGGGVDAFGIDGIWVGEFAEAGYIKPLNKVSTSVDAWDGWEQIDSAVQQSLAYNGEIYGVPQGADGRVLYYNKTLFSQAGLPTEWNPTSWDEILEAARKLKNVDGITPIQLNAGTAMGEATTMQGLLPLLAGTGEQVWEEGKWVGDTAGMKQVLNLYKTIYVDEELGDPILQQEASGRDTSFQLFSEGQIGILLEGDYFWRSVVNPADGVGTAPMEDRDEVVGYAKIPAASAGTGINGQDFVSMSGGTGRVLNPNSENADLAWKLIEFMNSPEAYEAKAAGTLSISPRNDVNEKLLSSDEMLTYVSEEVLPITAYRPGLAAYPEISIALQQLTLDVVSGTDIDKALNNYVGSVSDIVESENVNSSK